MKSEIKDIIECFIVMSIAIAIGAGIVISLSSIIGMAAWPIAVIFMCIVIFGWRKIISILGKSWE